MSTDMSAISVFWDVSPASIFKIKNVGGGSDTEEALYRGPKRISPKVC
jgi:hypothetical protein